MELVESNLQSIREKLDQFLMKDVFNMDKQQFEGKKQDNKRLTIVFCCNEDGSEKIPLWFIDKCAKPRCFKNVNLSSMNCEKYVQQLNRKMDGRKVLLLVDNCPVHPKTIKLFFLPSNATSKIQSCAAGIIQAFKMHYDHRFIEIFWRVMKLGPKSREDKYFRCNESYNLGLDNRCSGKYNCIVFNIVKLDLWITWLQRTSINTQMMKAFNNCNIGNGNYNFQLQTN
ncbi:hypothetical protein UlMin_041245 [Ulmus minor]